MDQDTIQSLPEFLDVTFEASEAFGGFQRTTTPWFRGQSHFNWSLSPSLYRNEIDPTLERELNRDFRLRANSMTRKEPTSDLGWLFVMQHYGVPTRLIDWTESSLVALYFSVLDHSSTHDSAVWILDPWALNEASIGEFTVPTSDSPLLNDYCIKRKEDEFSRSVPARFPAAIRPERTTERIIAQKGCFTIHGKTRSSLNIQLKRYNESKNNLPESISLHKLRISGSCKEKIMKELLLSGISHSVIFPDLEGLSKEIKLRYSKKFMS